MGLQVRPEEGDSELRWVTLKHVTAATDFLFSSASQGIREMTDRAGVGLRESVGEFGAS